MRKRYMIWAVIAAASLVALTLSSCSDTDPFLPELNIDGAIVAGHDVVDAFESIPAATFDHIRANYRIYYGHTSHGSQIVTGVGMLAGENSDYESPHFHEPGGDLGHNGDITWASTTRAFLDAHPGDYNVVMWSWCGGVSDNTQAGIETYLNTMAQLEADYPDVIFIYMTGHLDGTGRNGNLYARNNQIRAFAAANDKILFDFADIESYDPDGDYYPDASDDCQWCSTWCSSHTCPACGSCAHSHCFNCYLKGKAFWWMMATIAGWES